jgi:threonine/homoserine/homoserine lactone efflux protein
MPLDTALALMTFAFVAAMTPGPNNIMLTASGVNFGFTRTVPHMAGICVGFVVLVLAIGAGVGAILATAPALQLGLKVLGAAYMLWLAWKVANAGSPSDRADERPRPMTFWQAAAFQWVNPKAWVMAVSAMALYVRPDYAALDVAIVTAVFGIMTLPAVGTWAAFGHALRNLLRDPARVRVFNVVMALLLAASIVPMVWG